MCLLIFLYGDILYMRTGETERQQKERQEKTMTKKKYKQILHTTKSPEKLYGIIRVAMYDTDIKPGDFCELLDEMNEIIMKERR